MASVNPMSLKCDTALHESGCDPLDVNLSKFHGLFGLARRQTVGQFLEPTGDIFSVQGMRVNPR